MRLFELTQEAFEAAKPLTLLDTSTPEHEVLALQTHCSLGAQLVQHIGEAHDTVEALQSHCDTLSAAAQDGAELSAPEAAVLQTAVEHLCNRLGMAPKRRPACALENFRHQPRRLQLALEGLGDFLAKIWKALVAAFNAVIDWLVGFFKKLFGAEKSIAERAQEVADRAEQELKAKGAAATAAPSQPAPTPPAPGMTETGADLWKLFAIDGKMPTGAQLVIRLKNYYNRSAPRTLTSTRAVEEAAESFKVFVDEHDAFLQRIANLPAEGAARAAHRVRIGNDPQLGGKIPEAMRRILALSCLEPTVFSFKTRKPSPQGALLESITYAPGWGAREYQLTSLDQKQILSFQSEEEFAQALAQAKQVSFSARDTALNIQEMLVWNAAERHEIGTLIADGVRGQQPVHQKESQALLKALQQLNAQLQAFAPKVLQAPEELGAYRPFLQDLAATLRATVVMVQSALATMEADHTKGLNAILQWCKTCETLPQPSATNAAAGAGAGQTHHYAFLLNAGKLKETTDPSQLTTRSTFWREVGADYEAELKNLFLADYDANTASDDALVLLVYSVTGTAATSRVEVTDQVRQAAKAGSLQTYGPRLARNHNGITSLKFKR